jgi:PilZ domain-containing protein
MDERRSLPRKYLVIYSRVFDRKTGSVIGYLSDLTPEGAMIIGEQPVEPQSKYMLRVDLPEAAIFSQRHIDLEAEAMWCKPDIDPNFYSTGFHFTNPSPENIIVIEQMIEAYEFRRDIDKYPPSTTEMQSDL